jgi:hypothetical protein
MVPCQVPNNSNTSRGNKGVCGCVNSLELEALNTDLFDLAARLRYLLVLHSEPPLPPPSPLARAFWCSGKARPLSIPISSPDAVVELRGGQWQ